MSEPSTIQLVIEGVVALGTLAVAVLAVWGNWIRSKLTPAKLTIEPYTPEGHPTPMKDGLRYYYHLKVVNKRPWLPVENCRVVLVGLTKRGPDNEFYRVAMPVPLQFVWSPSGSTPTSITFSKEHVLDFGFIAKGVKFNPTLYSYTNDFEGYVGLHEALRYHLEIEATNYVADKLYVFEVAWDGQWSDVRETMAQHLKISEIKSRE